MPIEVGALFRRQGRAVNAQPDPKKNEFLACDDDTGSLPRPRPGALSRLTPKQWAVNGLP